MSLAGKSQKVALHLRSLKLRNAKSKGEFVFLGKKSLCGLEEESLNHERKCRVDDV